jgi:hypothetical protein
MPVDVQWHPTWPVLIITYTGVVTAAEYAALNEQRRRMVDHGPEAILVIADLYAFQALSDTDVFPPGESVLRHSQVRHTLVVLPADLHARLAGAIRSPSPPPRYAVSLYPDLTSALAQAETLLPGLMSMKEQG